MRIRRKKNLGPRMEAAAHLITTPTEDLKGRWREVYGKPPSAALFVELGCGMGRFCVGMAEKHPEALFVAVERVPEALVVALERCADRELSNLRFIGGDVQEIGQWFGHGELDGIYLNFSDPWPKKKQFKRRLTHPGFLARYEPLLKSGGLLTFKTDNRPLFDFSLDALQNAPAWTVRLAVTDLHGPEGKDLALDTVTTEYEEKWMKAGVPICCLVAERK